MNAHHDDDRFDPLAAALRKEAAGLATPRARDGLRRSVLDRLDEPLPPERRPLVFPALATLAAAALLALVVLPFVRGPGDDVAAAETPIAAEPPGAGEPVPALPAELHLPRLRLPSGGELAAFDPSDELDREARAMAEDLKRLGAFMHELLPGNPSPLKLL